MSVSDDCGNKEIAEPLKINDSETTTIGRDFVETTDEWTISSLYYQTSIMITL